MNTKEILQKQNARNTLSKKNKNKLLAVFLSGGLVSCTIGWPTDSYYPVNWKYLF